VKDDKPNVFGYNCEHWNSTHSRLILWRGAIVVIVVDCVRGEPKTVFDEGDERIYEPCIKCGSMKKQVLSYVMRSESGEGEDTHRLRCLECYKGLCTLPIKIEAEDAESYVLHFGKHKGSRISNVPKDYLRWVRRNAGLKSSHRHIDAYLNHGD